MLQRIQTGLRLTRAALALHCCSRLAQACGPRLAQVAINPQALPLHALGAVGKRTLSNTQLPTIVGGLVRAQRAKFLDRDVTRDDSKVSALPRADRGPHPH